MNSQMNLVRAELHRDGLRNEADRGRRGEAVAGTRKADSAAHRPLSSYLFGRVLRSGWNF